MRRSRKILGAAIALCVAAAGLQLVVGARPARTQVDPASRAIQYLQSQQSALNGAIPSSPGSYGPSEMFAVSAAAAGYDPNSLRAGMGPSVMDYLAANVVDASSTAGKTGELIQAVVAAGRDPHAFAGHDLVATVVAGLNASTGALGDGQAFNQALAIQGLVAAGATVPAAALTYVVNAQNSDGGWDYLNIHNDPNPLDFATSDTNSTAMSLMALDSAGNHSRDSSGRAWLHTQQSADGGFPYQAGSGSDPDSTALVLQAIVATGADPAAGTWTKGGHTPLAELIATQDAGGGYRFPGNAAPDAFTTSQVPLGLLMQPLPATGSYSGGFTPAAEAHATLQSLLYLQTQQSAADGSFTGVTATFDPSELYAIGAAAAGYDPKVLRAGAGPSVIDFLGAHAAAACAKAGQCGRLIQAVVAAGLNPHAFGGMDLVAMLQSFFGTTISGAYGDGQTFGQTLAIQGLIAAGATPPATALDFLVTNQDSDGGWNWKDVKDDPNPLDFATSDTNSTAMALMSLDAAGNHSRDASALAWLHKQQNADGGFPYQAGSGSDPDSTALVLQAIMGSGDNPASPQWSKGGHTAISALAAMQTTGGGFVFPGNAGTDVFTTAQVPVALERVAFPVPFGQHAFYQPGATLGSSIATPPPTTPPSPGTTSPAGLLTPPVVVQHAAATPPIEVATAQPSATAVPTSTPAATPTSGAEAATASPTPAVAPIGKTPAPQPGAPLLLIYLAVGLAATGVITGGGVLMARRR
jgi:prenyltransferase beta subunit